MVVAEQLQNGKPQQISITGEPGLVVILSRDTQSLTAYARYFAGGIRPADSCLEIHERVDVGYMPVGAPMHDGMTVKEWLIYMAQMRGLNKILAAEQAEELMEQYGLQDLRDRYIGKKLQMPERRQAVLLQTMLGNPAMIVLDQPMAGLEMEERQSMYDMLLSMQKEHTVVVFGLDPDYAMEQGAALYLLQEEQLVSVSEAELMGEYQEIYEELKKAQRRDEESLDQILEDYEGGSRNEEPNRSK